MDPASLLVAEQVVSTTVEGAVVAGIGLAQSTMPLKATFTRITSEGFLPRSSHSLTVIDGRAYIFGGESSPGVLAGDEVHIVSLPSSSNAGEPDYKCVPALEQDGSGPGPRAGHTASAIGDRIYIFGGRGKDKKPLEENGRVWVFDTDSLHWSHLEPTENTPYPSARYQHASVISEHPLPNNAARASTYTEQIQSTIAKIPSLISKPSPPATPHGTLILHGGLSSSTTPQNDTWAFTIPTKTWSPLPSSPEHSNPSPSLALSLNCLYLISSGASPLSSSIHYLPLSTTTYPDARGASGELGLAPEIPTWTTLPFPTNPLTPNPEPRKGASLLPISTSNGRAYLIYLFGETHQTPDPASDSEQPQHPTYHSTLHSYQPPPHPTTAASLKDSTRETLGISTGQGTWEEVKVVANEESGIAAEGKSHPGPRGWFGSAVTGAKGGEVLLWGGLNAKGEVEGDGGVVRIE